MFTLAQEHPNPLQVKLKQIHVQARSFGSSIHGNPHWVGAKETELI